MGMDGVLYGYIVRNLRKPKKYFCLSIGLDLSFVWKTIDRGVLKRLTKLSVRQLVISTTRCLKLVVVDT